MLLCSVDYMELHELDISGQIGSKIKGTSRPYNGAGTVV